jgi:hypothetical protein
MSDTAAWLVDRILKPELRWRQYVVTFPAPVAVGLCFRTELAAAVTRVCIRVLFEHQRGRADARARGRPKPAAVVWIQRFSDGAVCWWHLHILAPDGVFRQLPNSLDVPFETQPAPRPKEVVDLVGRIARRVTGLVQRRTVGSDGPLLERCALEPATAERRPTPPPGRVRRPDPLRAECDGFTVHAATSVGPHDSAALERLCRYLARPPIAAQRLSLLPDGRVSLRLKRPRRGVRRFVFEPPAFIARMAALIPRPMTHQVLYFGALSAASPLRPHILPTPPPPTSSRPTAPARPKRMSHAERSLQRRLRAELR